MRSARSLRRVQVIRSVMSKTAGSSMAMATSSSMVESKPTLRLAKRLPTRAATPAGQGGNAKKQQRGTDDRAGDLRLHDPDIAPADRMNRASTSSAALPKLTFSRLPIVAAGAHARPARCRVAPNPPAPRWP